MLDGKWTDNLEVLILANVLDVFSGTTGSTTSSYQSEEVHKFTVNEWSPQYKKRCKLDISLAINDTQADPANPSQVTSSQSMTLTQSSTSKPDQVCLKDNTLL